MPLSNHRDEFIDHLLDLMRDLGAVNARRMFGGHGIYRGNVMFGLVSSQVLYLKADDGNRALFEAEDLEPFTYDGKSRSIQLSYYRAPDAALESPAIMMDWAGHAHEAALRSGIQAKKKKAAGKKTAGKKTAKVGAKTASKKKVAKKVIKKAVKKTAKRSSKKIFKKAIKKAAQK